MSSIICIAEAGLCNRIKCLVSAMRFAELTQRRLLLYWPKNDRCGAAFEDIFASKFEEIRSLPNVTIFSRSNCVPLEASGDIALKTWRFAISDAEWRRGVREQDLLYDQSHLDLTVKTQVIKHLRTLRFRQDIIERAELFRSRYLAEPYWGMHIRGTDHKLSRSLSSLESFLEQLSSLKKENANEERVFLATEDPTIKKLAVSQRPLITCSHNLPSRSDPVALHEAVIDLLILAKAQRLLGSYGSTFSEIAWWMGGFPPFHLVLNDGTCIPSNFPDNLVPPCAIGGLTAQ